MGTISKNFSYAEFEKTDVPGMQVKNTITSVDVRDSIKELVDTVIQPLRDAWGKPLAINSGYRCPEVNQAVGGVPTSQHCFDTDTEILTNNGWKTSTTISIEDLVYTYSFSYGSIELKAINEIIHKPFVGELYHIKNKHLDVMCTDKHNVIVRYDNHKYQRKGVNKITAEGQAYFDSLKTNNDQFHLEKMEEVAGKRRHFMTCGYTSETTDYDVMFMKFVMAVVADGYFGFHCGKTPYIGFHVKKERKITYLKVLMKLNGIKYSVRREKDGTYYFYIGKSVADKVLEIIGKKKNIPYYILKADVRTLRELVGTYTFFDGHCDIRHGNIGISISTVNANNASVLQAMCVLSGMRCILSSKIPELGSIRGVQIKTAQRVYSLSICPDKISSKFKEDSFKKVHYSGEVWCIRDDNDTVIVRRNGKVSLQGNCKGEAADVCPFGRNGSGNVDVIRQLAQKASELKLPFDQMILYPTFVHFSHKKNGTQRGQILYNKRYTGKKL